MCILIRFVDTLYSNKVSNKLAKVVDMGLNEFGFRDISFPLGIGVTIETLKFVRITPSLNRTNKG